MESTISPSPCRKPIRRVRIGMESSISAIASARQPTKIPANRPVRASTVRASHSKSCSRFQPFLQPFPAKNYCARKYACQTANERSKDNHFLVQKKIFSPVWVFPAKRGTSPTESRTVKTPAETRMPAPSPTTTGKSFDKITIFPLSDVQRLFFPDLQFLSMPD